MNILNIQDIFKQLPHRYPFLLVDRVLEMTAFKSLRAIKNVTINEQFFEGHFPGNPVMPGVLMIEALAQAAAILAFSSLTDRDPKTTLFYLGSIENTRFRRVVIPGDQLILEVELLKHRNKVWKFTGVAKVNGEIVCSTEMTSVESKN